MICRIAVVCCSTLTFAAIARPSPAAAQDQGALRPLPYNNPGLAVDLGVGLWAWPLPMDFDRDGDLDLVVACPDKPSNGIYFFENPEGGPFPIFRAARRIDRATQNLQVSYDAAGEPTVTGPGIVYDDFRARGLAAARRLPLPAKFHPGKIRANQWKLIDLDGDAVRDLVVGVGDWTDYGWDDAWNSQGQWTNGPLHGYVYWSRNRGDEQSPKFDPPVKIEAAGKPVDVFGWPSPNFADFDGDGDLDLLCGEFLDKFTYFENTGGPGKVQLAAGRRLARGGAPLAMDLQMIVPVAIDWDGDEDQDLIVGDEDGRVAWVEHTGEVVDGLPQFLPPRYFRQQADTLKFGALSTPAPCDWDGDGDQDLLCGNTAGHIGWFENLGTPAGMRTPRWSAPRLLNAGGEVLRIQAGPNGSIQGPCEAKWGYTTQSVADWDADGLPDIVCNSIWGKVHWYRNLGRREQPRLAAARPVEVAWPGQPPKPAWTWWTPAPQELATQWRTTPLAVDINDDNRTDLVSLDHEGYLTLLTRRPDGLLDPPRRAFVDAESGRPLRLNGGRAGRSGRRKLWLTDFNGDGRLDLLANSSNADWWENVGGDAAGEIRLRNRGPLDERVISAHTTSPCAVDFNDDGVPELLVGAEDGRLYYQPQTARQAAWASSPSP